MLHARRAPRHPRGPQATRAGLRAGEPPARLTADPRLRLVLVTDRRLARSPLPRVVAAALRGGVTAVALREKDLDARSLLQLARALRPLTRRHGALLIVNDRADVARAAGADGVHLGQRSLPVDAARRALGRGLVGVSTHTLAEARAAERAGADYVFYGPIHDTPSKRGRLAPRGPRGLRRVAAALGIPVVAIGGIDPDRAAALGRAGAAGVAAIRGLVAARRPATAARAYRASWAAAAGAAARPRG